MSGCACPTPCHRRHRVHEHDRVRSKVDPPLADAVLVQSNPVVFVRLGKVHQSHDKPTTLSARSPLLYRDCVDEQLVKAFVFLHERRRGEGGRAHLRNRVVDRRRRRVGVKACECDAQAGVQEGLAVAFPLGTGFAGGDNGAKNRMGTGTSDGRERGR